MLCSLAACRTLEESAVKPPNFADISTKIVKYVQYSHDFGENSALFGQFFALIPKARQAASESGSSSYVHIPKLQISHKLNFCFCLALSGLWLMVVVHYPGFYPGLRNPGLSVLEKTEIQLAR